ncbi:Cytochrome c6 [Thalassoglobus polymorphus]|uniref:Cytochrome c6 n=2 Tax=Thalassoglobus polymorphus TaxID=2527994 RepID=A0A517QMM5_9PLAN|nr:Cytochrome c6 [Thalassoglobus polymorphus]
MLLCCFVGCQSRTEQPDFVSSEEVENLPPELKPEVRKVLREYAGSFEQPVLLMNDGAVSKAQLKLGQAVYQKRCVQCHGVSGDGNGPVASSMYPRPRDYRKGVYKFTSTPYGSKPVRSDLIRTVTNGVRGTSMPSFKMLPPEEIEAVVDYVLALTHRGELELQIAVLADFEEEVDLELVEEESIPLLKRLWERAAGSQVVPMSPQPVFTQEHIDRGREAFLTKGCSKCHGEDGRGQTPDNLAGNLKDIWGNVTRAADLTGGMLRGGQRPIDVYRRIFSGINGTPMPGFGNAFKQEPETMWDLTAYVLHVTNSRRMGVSHLPGQGSPYIPVTEETDDATD